MHLLYLGAFHPGVTKVFTLLILLASITACSKEETALHFPLAASNGIDNQLLFEAVEKAGSELNNPDHEPGQQRMNTISLIMNEILDYVL